VIPIVPLRLCYPKDPKRRAVASRIEAMVRVAIHSPDLQLKRLLTSALKSEFSVLADFDEHGLRELLENASKLDVLVLDCDSNRLTLDGQLALFEEIGNAPVPIIVMTDDVRRSTAVEFLRRGAFDCIRKPPSLIEFKVIIGRAHEQELIKAELERARQALSSQSACDQLVGSSGRSQIVYDLIRRVADLPASVLITGESGTGKELVARAIHNLGNRTSEPFIAVSCGAIPETLIESELFGHERGAFTGSTGARAGYLEQAGRGTLLLDEVGELSPSIQVKLLRVLQEREFSRLGSNRLTSLNARVLFATHRNLREMSQAGTFRKDLFFRVNVMNIHVPPLRERTEDIPALARHFLAKYAKEYEKPIDDIVPAAMELLVEYPWPGNVRELENVLQRAVILANGNELTSAELPEPIRQIAEEIDELEDTPGSFEDLVRQFKVGLAHQAVVDCQGNKTLAAKKLKVSRAYLHRLIRGAENGGEIPSESAGSISFPQSRHLS
jgi:DNA-binding NtrC family response regulator